MFMFFQPVSPFNTAQPWLPEVFNPFKCAISFGSVNIGLSPAYLDFTILQYRVSAKEVVGVCLFDLKQVELQFHRR